jgi:carbon monoxide dehydrogenase subunit G
MQVTLDKTYPIKAPLQACWGVLSDIAELATCMPGAAITEKIDEKNYKGSVKVKVGPATAAFAGDIEVISVDEINRTLVMMGKVDARTIGQYEGDGMWMCLSACAS